jgi:hypothetical protein
LRRRFLYGGVAAALALNVLLFTNRHHTPKGYILRVASDTCYCYPFNRIIDLHLSKDGFITIDSEAVQPNKLGTLLSEIYAVRAERILYLSADSDVQYESLAAIIDVTQNLEFSGSVPEPSALKHVRPMRVEVRLITNGSIGRSCPTGCSNWFKQPLVIPKEAR